MPRYRFSWSNLPEGFTAAACEYLGLAGDPDDALRAAYGARPKEQFVADTWPLLLEGWLPLDEVAREGVVTGLREAGLGDLSIDVSEAAGQLEYLHTCRAAKTLREIVLLEFHLFGEPWEDADEVEAPVDGPAPVAETVQEEPAPEPLAVTAATQNEVEVGGRDVGLEVLDGLYERLMIDDEWSLRWERKFMWWSYRLAQTVEAGPRFEIAPGVGASIIKITTAVARHVTDDPARLAALATVNAMGSLSSLVYDSEGHLLFECCTLTVNDDTVDFGLDLLSAAAVLQNTSAHSRAPAVAEAFGGDPDTSFCPTSGHREVMDDLLNVPAALVAPAGAEPSRFAGALIERLLELQPAPWSMANGDDTDFVAEVPFSSELSALEASFVGEALGSALIRVLLDSPHPEYGSGALIMLALPLMPEDVAAAANQLNAAEAVGDVMPGLLGSWCRDPGGGLAFVAFVPNLFAQPGLLENLVIYQAVRARWAHGMLAST